MQAAFSGDKPTWAYPMVQYVQRFLPDFGVLASARAGTWKRMIGVLAADSMSPSGRVARRSGCSRSSDAVHRLCPGWNSIGIAMPARCWARSNTGLPAGCNGKARKASPRTCGKRFDRLCLGSHASAERSATGEQRQ